MTEVNSQIIKDLQNKGEKILVQLSASWCGPCKQLTPRLANMGNEFEKVVFVKVDVDNNMEFAQELEVRSVPTVLIYDGNKLINRSTGVQNDKFYKDILNAL
jgi:thioredoxin 1